MLYIKIAYERHKIGKVEERGQGRRGEEGTRKCERSGRGEKTEKTERRPGHAHPGTRGVERTRANIKNVSDGGEEQRREEEEDNESAKRSRGNRRRSKRRIRSTVGEETRGHSMATGVKGKRRRGEKEKKEESERTYPSPQQSGVF